MKMGMSKRTYMNILILSCNTGEGHNSAARAISEHLAASGIGCTVTDTLSLVSRSFSQTISDMYLYSTRTSLFKHIYRIGGAVSDGIRSKSIIYLWNMMYSGMLLDYINGNGFDAVICVHLFPAEAMTALKVNGKTDIPCIFVMTDYTCIPFLDETELDGYVIPHEHLVEEFTQKGLPREKLFPFGIPVSSRFHDTDTRTRAREEILSAFGWEIPQGRDWFLVMTGSMGFGNTEELLDEMLRQASKRCEIIVVCGRNMQMTNALNERYAAAPNVRPIGYTDRIPLLMDACDVLFTKPGGISSTEAMSKHIPIIHTAPIPGCETRNAEFFHYHGMSYSSTDPAQQVHIALRLCHDASFRTAMTEAQRLNSKPDTCSNICSLLPAAA